MSELKLRRVRIRNWMTIRQAELEFPDSGLVLVTGSNLASGGKMESVGSGKTALGEALSRALTGVAGRYTNLGHYSTNGKGDMYVNLEADLGGEPLVVEIGHKCKEFPNSSGEGLRFKYGDREDVERGIVRETRQELASAISVTPELAEWTVYIDGDRLRFNKQSERDSVGLLMTALQQPSWDKINERARKMLGTAQRDVETEETKVAWMRTERDRLDEAIKSAERALKAEEARVAEEAARLAKQRLDVQNGIVENTHKLTELQARQKAIKAELKRLEVEGAAAYTQLEKKRLALTGKVNEVQFTRNELVEQKAQAYAGWQTQNRLLTEMQSVPKNCPTCGKPWEKAHGDGEISKQSGKVASAKKAYDSLVAKIQNVDKTASGFRQQVADVEHEISALRTPAKNDDLSYEYEANERTINSVHSAINQAQLRLNSLQTPDQSGIERCKAILAERREQATKVASDLEASAAKLAEAKEVVKVVGYWTEAFGPTGIPNLILSEAIAPLNEISRRVSNLMTGGTIDISYATSRQLANGKGSSSELVINVNNKIGSKRIEGSSKGESGLTNLIIAETLSEVGSVSKRLGFRWYDEILNSQDPVVRRSILTYLKETAHRLGILIFVVDHHPEAASYADYVLLAQKSGKGETKLLWKTSSLSD